MAHRTCTDFLRSWPRRLLLCLFSAQLVACGGSEPAALQSVTARADAFSAEAVMSGPSANTAGDDTITSAPSTNIAAYTVVNLSPDNPGEVHINRHGQVTFTLTGAGFRAKFFDGSTTVDLGSLGGGSTLSTSLNDTGQVTGSSSLASGRYHAFVWSAKDGMSDLGTLGDTPGQESSSGTDINNKGQVIGSSNTNLPRNHPFLWSKATGMVDLGALLPGVGGATAINDKEQIAGDRAVGLDASRSYFWSRADGFIDLGTLGGDTSLTVDINKQGVVVGNSTTAHTPELFFHAFTWTRSGGMLDLGTLGGTESSATAINGVGQVVGIANAAAGFGHAFIWSRDTGMADLGTLGGTLSRATAINDHGWVAGLAQVAGDAEHAFVWCQGQGMVDLNSVIPRAPSGLLLTRALAIDAQGAIVANSNAGLVLLKPGNTGTPAPVVGPISSSPDPAVAGAPAVLSVPFTDTNVKDTHRVTWSWGDGSADTAGTVVESGRAGVASGTHVYSYGASRMSVTVTDSTGRSASAGRFLEVTAP